MGIRNPTEFSRHDSLFDGARFGNTVRDGWRNFLTDLTLSQNNQISNRTPQNPESIYSNPVLTGSGGGSGGGGFEGNAPLAPNPSAIAHTTLRVFASNLYVGQLVHYAAASVSAADCRDVNKWANFIVVAMVPGGYVDISDDVASMPIAIKSGRGTNPLGTLYLYQDGATTDDDTDLVTANGVPVGGAQIKQIVGTSQFNQGSAPVGFVRGKFRDGSVSYIV